MAFISLFKATNNTMILMEIMEQGGKGLIASSGHHQDLLPTEMTNHVRVFI